MKNKYILNLGLLVFLFIFLNSWSIPRHSNSINTQNKVCSGYLSVYNQTFETIVVVIESHYGGSFVTISVPPNTTSNLLGIGGDLCISVNVNGGSTLRSVSLERRYSSNMPNIPLMCVNNNNGSSSGVIPLCFMPVNCNEYYALNLKTTLCP
jgi:hypothetical protein